MAQRQTLLPDAPVQCLTYAGVFATGDASSVNAHRCRVLSAETNGAIVTSGATCQLHSCQLLRNGQFGLLVRHFRSNANCMQCVLANHQDTAAVISLGGSATLTNCELTGSKACHGLTVTDPGSYAECVSCTMANNQDTAAVVCKGAKATLRGCQLSGSKVCHGLSVIDAGSHADCLETTLTDNQDTAVVVCHGATAMLRDCSLTRSRACHGLSAIKASDVQLTGCQVTDNKLNGVTLCGTGKVQAVACDLKRNGQHSAWSDNGPGTLITHDCEV
jgi:hypothetical protein